MNDKQSVRERIWAQLDASPALGLGRSAVGRIPAFAGAERAAERLAGCPEWGEARVLKMNPDTPQLALRALAIEAGKLVYVAVPKLVAELPFLALERSALGAVAAIEAASIAGAAAHGTPTRLEDMAPLDLIVCGSVAVNAAGARIGKGGGYADIEYALLAELGLVSERTLIATTVHDVQLLDEPLPETPHDFRVDLIATPTQLLRCERVPRPTGIDWQELSVEKVAAIPALAARSRHSTST